MTAENWLQYNIYTDMAKLDACIEKVVKTVKSNTSSLDVNIKRWFFIRYLDDTGCHLRLRFLVEEEQLASSMDIFEQELHAYFEPYKVVDFRPLKRIIPIGTSNSLSTVGSERIELALYDPELEKYGGEIGLDLSEKLFERSSDFVLSIIHDINTEAIDRYHVALIVMKVTLDTFLKEGNISSFLEYYLSYWSGDKFRDTPVMEKNFKEAATKKREVTQKILNNEWAFLRSPEYVAYATGLKETYSSVISNNHITKDLEHLCFNYIHMMNNRLGVWPIEESYLAALLLSTYE